MVHSWAQDALAVLCGGAVGFSLGLIGGGGSIFAVPLLLYVVGIGDAHVAIGTSASVVAANAFLNLIGHWRAGNVVWPCAATFAAAGIVGAAIGSSLGKIVDGQHLLFLFALAMIAVAAAMLLPRADDRESKIRMTPAVTVRLVLIGLVVGMVSGFFGIGGGFLIVPGIMFGSGMAILDAIGSSLLAVGMFGLTTAVNYAISGLVDWTMAVLFIIGGIGGGFLGMRSAIRLAQDQRLLRRIFAAIVFAVAIYMLARVGLPTGRAITGSQASAISAYGPATVELLRPPSASR
ncbi:MAG TPA: sulfite exporter TauE/SafE family protein [Xanthobacteraceae bacterium]|nr:sulfite exporter TauE/SafE family protein [Xanthobacteraceae bacterium]